MAATAATGATAAAVVMLAVPVATVGGQALVAALVAVLLAVVLRGRRSGMEKSDQL